MTHSHGNDCPPIRDAISSARLQAPDRDRLSGKIAERRQMPVNLSKGLDQRLGAARRTGFKRATGAPRGSSDMRQRVVVKIHFFGHGGGGGAALSAHARYVARDEAASRPLDLEPAAPEENVSRPHANYLQRDDPACFYDALTEGVDGAARMAVWAREDRRHFRLIIAAENGVELKDLKPFIRDIMDEAERALGSRLEWVAIDHFDTSQPHTHIVLRGRRANGRPLIIPKDYVKHGFREAARRVATQRLGQRTRQDERRALEREARAHRPTRLDHTLALRTGPDGKLRIADLAKRNDAPEFSRALKLRARELQGLGLARELGRNVLSMHADWREQLMAMELHLDIRKRIVQQRTKAPSIAKTPGVQIGHWRF